MATDRASLSKVVSEQIRGQILDGKLRPGERLVEDRLSTELGVSRVPVREALRGLSMEGLVRLEPNRGASVAEITSEMVAELVEVRTLLEALERLAGRAPPRSRDRRRPARHAEARQRRGAVRLARSARAAQRRVPRAPGRSQPQLRAVRHHALPARAHLPRLLHQRPRARARDDWKEHAGILAAVIDGDEELAALLASRHVQNAAAAFAKGAAAANGQTADQICALRPRYPTI